MGHHLTWQSGALPTMRELVASIAHEVGQPLTAISTNTEASLLWMARSPPDVGEIQKLCTRNLAEVQRAVNVIQRIRSMAIRATPERQRENLNFIVADALPFLRPELQRREVMKGAFDGGMAGRINPGLIHPWQEPKERLVLSF